MGNKPFIIALEGIDGSGKSVQFKRLHARLEAQGLRVGVLDFPCYDSFFGREIGKMLSNAEGVSAAVVDVKSMSLWYAMDRRIAFNQFDLGKYDVVLLNRSTMANAAYQGSRISDAIRAEAFIQWIFDLEFMELQIPQPELFFIFDIPTATSRANVAKKGHRDYVGDDADVYEKDLAFLESVRKGYHLCAEIFPGTVLLSCAEEDGSMKPMEVIEEQVWTHIKALLQL